MLHSEEDSDGILAVLSCRTDEVLFRTWNLILSVGHLLRSYVHLRKQAVSWWCYPGDADEVLAAVVHSIWSEYTWKKKDVQSQWLGLKKKYSEFPVTCQKN